MSATSILINVGAATSGAVRNLKDVRDELDRVDGSSTRFGGSSKAMKAGIAGIAAAGAAVAAGLGVAITKMVEFGQAAWEDEQAARNLAKVLENVGVPQSEIDKNAAWIDSMELATLVADTKLRDAVGRLTAQTGDLGLAQSQAALAADLATGANISYEKAVKAIQAANEGAMGPLSKYVNLQDKNKDGTISLDEAMQGLKKSYKGAADEAANNNPWGRIKTLWDQMREALGQWLLPVMDRLAEWFKSKENQQKIRDFIDKTAELSKEWGEKLVKALEKAYNWLKSEEGQQAIADLKQLMKDLGTATKTVVGWFNELNGWKWVFDLNPIIALARTWERVKAAIQWVLGNSDGARRSGGGTFGRVAPATFSGVAAYGRTGPTTSNVVNLYGGATEADARLIKRVLEGYDIAQGRGAGQPLRIAW